MPCDQTEATLLWLYGEGESDQTAHVAGCAACSALLAETEAVLAVVPVGRVPVAAPLRRRIWPWAVPLLLAAGALWALRPVDPPELSRAPLAVRLDSDLDDDLDDDLDALDDDLDLLLADLGGL